MKIIGTSAKCVVPMWMIKRSSHIGKENTLLVWFFVPIFPVPYEYFVKEGDRVGHVDNVLTDNRFYQARE